MQEPTSEPLGPAIKTAKNQESYRPYQELKERLGPQKYDAIIVFGEGPVKRVFFSSEKEKINELYKKNQIEKFNKSTNSKPPEGIPGKKLIDWLETQGPRTQFDPDFTIVDISPHGQSKSDPTKDINPNFERVREILTATEHNLEERKNLFEKFRTELENKARHSYKRYGELNALATGLTLYTGKTDKIIFSGGRTIPDDKIKQGLGFPSEAELMRDIVIRNFGQKMFERDNPHVIALSKSDQPEDKKRYSKLYEEYKTKTIHKYFVIEDSATNTIDNIIRSINHAPATFFNKEKTPEIGLLGNNHQIERCITLLNLFTGNEKGAHAISAQNDVLKPFADIRNKSGEKGFFPELLRYMTDEPTNIDLQEKTSGEAIGREKLENPDDMFWWLGYISHSDVPEVFNVVINKLKDPEWKKYSVKGFEKLNLNFGEFVNIDDFKNHPNLIAKLREGFSKIIAGDASLRKEKVVL